MKENIKMRSSVIKLFIAIYILGLATTVVECNEDIQKQFNDYINAPAPEFKWHQTGNTFTTLTGGKAYVLNVTSIQWLDESVYEVIGGSSLWTHEIVVIVPRDLKYTNVSSIYMASAFHRCNTDKPLTGTTFDIEMADVIANDARQITVVSFQTPNCPLVFKADPD